MGNYQTKVINILVQDDEFDDIFTKYWLNKSYPDIKWYEYIVGGHSKFKNDSMDAKNILLKLMGYDRTNTPKLLTNGNGKVKYNSDEYKTFKNSVREDMKQFYETDGFNIQLVLTGQSAPFLNIMSEFINSVNDIDSDRLLTPSNIEIIIINSKHNSKKLFPALNRINNICNKYNITLTIREFNAYGSIGDGIKQWIDHKDTKFINCGTTNEFSQKIYELSKTNNMAKYIIQYGLKFNSSIVNKTVLKISESIDIMNTINLNECKSWDLLNLYANVKEYIGDLITTKDDVSELNIELCQKLSNDLYKVLQCAETQLKRIDDDLAAGNITNELALSHQKKLYNIRGWFRIKVEITKSNMIHFPIHDMAVVLIMQNNANLLPFNAYAIRCGESINIVKDATKTSNLIRVMHYVSQEPEITRKYIEELILKVIENN